jgi:hypothetical protein
MLTPPGIYRKTPRKEKKKDSCTLPFGNMKFPPLVGLNGDNVEEKNKENKPS